MFFFHSDIWPKNIPALGRLLIRHMLWRKGMDIVLTTFNHFETFHLPGCFGNVSETCVNKNAIV